MSLSPSSAARRVACPGSYQLEKKVPKTVSTRYATEENAAHWVASTMLANPGTIPVALTLTPTGELITQEMIDGACLYFNDIRAITFDTEFIEKKLDISNIHPDCSGTPDFWCMQNGIVYIWDYKYGHGYVDVYENWQLIEYAAGILKYLNVTGITDQSIKIIFTIVQPRCYTAEGPIRRWEIMASDLRPYFNKLINAEHEAMKENAICAVSDQCKYCPAAYMCDTLQKTTLNVVDHIADNKEHVLTPQQLGYQLKQLHHDKKVLDNRIAALEQQAISTLKKGETVPFYLLEQSYGRKQWSEPDEKIINIGTLFGLNLAKPTQAITPTQALALGMDESIVATLSEVLAGEIKLKPADNNKAKKIFSK